MPSNELNSSDVRIPSTIHTQQKAFWKNESKSSNHFIFNVWVKSVPFLTSIFWHLINEVNTSFFTQWLSSLKLAIMKTNVLKQMVGKPWNVCTNIFNSFAISIFQEPKISESFWWDVGERDHHRYGVHFLTGIFTIYSEHGTWKKNTSRQVKIQVFGTVLKCSVKSWNGCWSKESQKNQTVKPSPIAKCTSQQKTKVLRWSRWLAFNFQHTEQIMSQWLSSQVQDKHTSILQSNLSQHQNEHINNMNHEEMSCVIFYQAFLAEKKHNQHYSLQVFNSARN